MFKNKSISVIVPAYNEEKLISRVISTMPDFVDKIIVINDGSRDNTGAVIEEFRLASEKIVLINHSKKEGLGKSLIDGYVKSLELGMDITAVMAGDGQMDPVDLPNIIGPIAEDEADYAKGNRLLMGNIAKIMPRHRFVGNAFLTLLTKFATGYWHIVDPQCGYTAISERVLKSINIKKMKKGYGYNAHILNMLNMINARVRDVEVNPIYGEAKSKIKLGSYIPNVSYFLVKLFLLRMSRKYLVREFHPLIFFYFFSFINIVLIATPLTIRFFYKYFSTGLAPRTTLIILAFSVIMGFFSFFFGMWLDMEDNKGLRS